uniref:Uncharacterized protein n=1 Tax=Chlamydomonas euryale TaxID=1486919 RepID=A0A7R9YUC2_9CHLO|mmetsp:Transcript_26520/g.78777  ORF Transcript_26520/g.78777 Transcript_26520/m.78777 type:complete len:296 (+) Transcript_26520:616-1503(+)
MNVLFLHDELQWLSVLGSTLIAAGAVFVNLKPKPQPQQQQQPQQQLMQQQQQVPGPKVPYVMRASYGGGGGSSGDGLLRVAPLPGAGTEATWAALHDKGDCDAAVGRERAPLLGSAQGGVFSQGGSAGATNCDCAAVGGHEHAQQPSWTLRGWFGGASGHGGCGNGSAGGSRRAEGQQPACMFGIAGGDSLARPLLVSPRSSGSVGGAPGRVHLLGSPSRLDSFGGAGSKQLLGSPGHLGSVSGASGGMQLLGSPCHSGSIGGAGSRQPSLAGPSPTSAQELSLYPGLGSITSGT